MISREERGADPTAAVSPPVAAADAERRRKPNSDLLYPVLPEVSPLPPPPPAPHPPAQVPPPPGRAEPSAPAAEGGPGPSVKQEESSYDEEDEEDDEEEVSKGRDSKGRSRRLQRKGKKEGKHQFPLMQVPNPRLEGGPIMVVQRNWEPGEIKDVAEALPNPRKSGGIQFYAAVKDMDGVYQPSAWELSQVLKKKLGPAWAALGVSWDTGIQRLDNARWAQQMNSLENALKSRFPTTVDWSRLHAARQGDKEDVYDWELRLQSLMEQYSGAGVEQQGQMMAAFYVEGLQPEIRELLKQVCPDWRERNMAGVRAFAQNIERNLKDTEKRKSIQEEKKKGKREKEHEMLFQAEIAGTGGEEGQFIALTRHLTDDPLLKLRVEGREILFLVDTGATRSTIREVEVSGVPTTGRTIKIIGASGIPGFLEETEPLLVERSPGSIVCQHQFLVSPHCPVNLLGRDLMGKLGMKVELGVDGLTVTSEALGLFCLSEKANFAAWWLVDDTIVRDCIPEGQDQPDRLHCTAQFFGKGGAEWTRDFEAAGGLRETVVLDYLYVAEDKSAASVRLSAGQKQWYVGGSVPHVSYGKKGSLEWKDLGPWVAECEKRTEWVRVEEGRWMSGDGQVQRYKIDQCVEVQRKGDAIEDKGKGIDPLPDWLGEVPDCLWAKGKNDFGRVVSAEPLVVHPKSDFRPHKAQYPLSREAVEGVREVHADLVKRGAIKEIAYSPVNSPILPVKKANGTWRFVQDLRGVNAAIHPRAPIVPNPITILASIPAEAKWFSVIDLANAFFSIPVDPHSQYWFAFTFQGKRWTWTVMPQGYTESPSVYGQELAKNLEGFTAPGGSTLVQYVDDLLLCSHTRESCKQDTIAMLDFLAKNGHKASKEKLQLVSQRVKYLGHVLTSEGRSLGPDRVASIQEMPKPKTKQQLLSVLGMIGYCRPWIQDYAQRSQPLVDLTIGLGLTDKLTWTTEAEDALIDLKQALMSAPALGLPDYQKPFVQYVDEKKGFMTSVLTQYHGGRCKPVAYYSKRLDSVARALPPCLRAVAATAEAVMASADLVQLHPLTLRVPHAVHAILTQARTSHLTPARSVHYQNVLLTLANVTVERCSALNPATLLPTGVDGEPHDCLQVIDCVCRPRPDLTDIPLEGGNILFVDGSSLRLEDGSPATSYAVVRDGSLVDGGQLPRHWSAQAAELFALQQACKLAEGQKVTIYTDSRYAFGVCHDHGALWKQRGFRTSTGKPIQHHQLVEQLLDALMLPEQVAIVKCQAHTKRTDEISQGNDLADQWAKGLAKDSTGFGNKVLLAMDVDKLCADNDLVLIQTGATEGELRGWKRNGARCDGEGVWRHSGTNRPYLPRSAYPGMAKAVHGLDHASRDGMVAAVTRVWHAPGFATAAAQFCGRCMVCMKFNVGKGIPSDPAVTPSPQSPFDHLQMDFIELTPCRGYKYCLVIVDLFSSCVTHSSPTVPDPRVLDRGKRGVMDANAVELLS
ncbi:uncharacterized protein [Paramormyrops kingsleyae]|uniref:uncharacterized protein n=1 Tax=Paramormyrops kingsleyae TaxID=1676925 RepID=UPI003B97B4E8